MAHWAQIDENSIVTQVTVGDNNDQNGDEGYQWLVDNVGGTWIKTSYNSYGGKHYKEVEEQIEIGPDTYETIKNRIESNQPHFRYNFAGIGYYYDSERDAFIPPKPESNPLNEEGNEINGEWILNEETCLWDFVPEE